MRLSPTFVIFQVINGFSGLATGRTAGVRFPTEVRCLSLLHCIQSGSGAHPSLIEWVPWDLCPGREADHSPPSSVEVKNGGTIPPLPHMSSWNGALHL
jgi:hypothetical protein